MCIFIGQLPSVCGWNVIDVQSGYQDNQSDNQSSESYAQSCPENDNNEYFVGNDQSQSEWVNNTESEDYDQQSASDDEYVGYEAEQNQALAQTSNDGYTESAEDFEISFGIGELFFTAIFVLVAIIAIFYWGRGIGVNLSRQQANI